MGSYFIDREIFLILLYVRIVPASTLIISSMVSTTIKIWLLLWVCLELNTTRFILQIVKEKKKENVLVFFVFQSLASISLIIYLSYTCTINEQNKSLAITHILLISIIIKIAIFPFHAWIIIMVGVLCWINLTVILTWQKIIPIVIILKVYNKVRITTIIIICIIISLLILISVRSMKKITLLSSILHNGWMFLSIVFIKKISIIYLGIYSTIISTISWYFIKINSNNINQRDLEKNKFNNIIVAISLSGIPPSTGFILKIIIICSLLTIKIEVIKIIMLIVTTLIRFFVYIKILFKIIIIKLTKKNLKNPPLKNNKNMLIIINVLIPIFMLNL